MPFKTFTSTVLSSSDVNTYLMNQENITCTSGTHPSSPTTGMKIFETDTNRWLYWSGTAWVYLGPQLLTFSASPNFTVSAGVTHDETQSVTAPYACRALIIARMSIRLNMATTEGVMLCNLFVDGGTKDADEYHCGGATGATGVNRTSIVLHAPVDLTAGAHTVLMRAQNTSASTAGLFYTWQLSVLFGVAGN